MKKKKNRNQQKWFSQSFRKEFLEKRKFGSSPLKQILSRRCEYSVSRQRLGTKTRCNTIVGFVFQAGMLRGDHGEFWLEPVALSPEEERVRLEEERLEDAGAEGRGAAGLYRNSVPGRPHLVFRRSVEQPQLEIGAAGRARRRRKKKKKLERNCGTRGENPPTPFSPFALLPSSSLPLSFYS